MISFMTWFSCIPLTGSCIVSTSWKSEEIRKQSYITLKSDEFLKVWFSTSWNKCLIGWNLSNVAWFSQLTSDVMFYQHIEWVNKCRPWINAPSWWGIHSSNRLKKHTKINASIAVGNFEWTRYKSFWMYQFWCWESISDIRFVLQ